MLPVYVDDMIITSDDEGIAQLKTGLGKKFEVKDFGQFRYFLGIKIIRETEGIVLSQRKYVLDLLIKTNMLDCKLVVSPIDVKVKINADVEERVDRERYQKLVNRLIYLCHTCLDISFAVSVVSRYMHDPGKDHMDAISDLLDSLLFHLISSHDLDHVLQFIHIHLSLSSWVA
jgi:Reverse transcriptase (RNA-dependent DNA polymerase)